MAIHPAHPGITVRIMVNGQPLPEFDGTEAVQEPSVMSKYIEAQAGSEFKITSTFTDPSPEKKDTNIRYYMDGIEIRSDSYPTSASPMPEVCTATGVRRKNGHHWETRAFRFENLSIGDVGDDNDSGYMNMLGTIRIKINHGTMVKSFEDHNLRSSLPRHEVSEKDLKGEAKSLQVGLRATHKAKRPKYSLFIPDAAPFVTFVFKYRSRANLQSLHIIPRTPSLSPSPSPVTRRQETPERVLRASFPAPPPSSRLIPSGSTPEASTTTPTARKHTTTPTPTPSLQARTPALLRVQSPSATQASPAPPAAQQHITTPSPSLPNATVSPPLSHSAPPRYSSTTALPPRWTSNSSAPTTGNGLDSEEIIAMITIYRGHDAGLAGQSKKSLFGLLKYYESKDADSVRVKRECSVTEVEEVFVKRERDDGGDVVARGKEKRRKTERRRQAEVVVIDD